VSSDTYRRTAQVAVGVLVALLAAWHLTSFPATWYDEGVNLQAARNLAQSGQYGLVYEDHVPRPFDLQLTTGPTVIGPVAAVFGVFGVGLRQGRIVMLVFTLLAALGLYRLAGKLHGPLVASLAVLALCASGEAGPGATRAVVGEIAALAFLLWGTVLFVRARRGGSVWDDLAAGALFGLAVLTKGQFGLLIPALIGAWLLTRRSGGLTVRRLALVCSALVTPVAAWQLWQLISLGGPAYLEHQQDQRAALSVSSSAPPLSETWNNAQYLLSSPGLMLGLIGLAYVLWRARRVGASAQNLVLPFFAGLWLVWYLGFSVGYARYAIPLFVTCTLFSAVLAQDMLHALRPIRLVLAVLVGSALLAGIASQFRVLAEQSDSSAAQMGALITREVEPQASIESLEWELDVLTDRTFHHPPPFVPAIPYAVPTSTAYLVDGPASKATQLYVGEREQNAYDHLAGVGPYDLYRRRPAY
jgi:4-amino-4-deoxy-L-arabinose transferase-like glycosyltransferase